MAKAAEKKETSKPKAPKAPKPNSSAPVEKDLLSPANNGQPEDDIENRELIDEEQIPLKELKDIPVDSKQMEEFKGSPDSMIPETGEDNKPPLELDKEALGEILSKQNEDDIKREEIRSKTEFFTNNKNEWKLIAKTYNNMLDWEHTTMAMAVGNRGVLVHIKEAVGQKINATSVYVDNGKLVNENGKWILK